ncbi:MAG: hypothetical protein Q9174_007489, partial [Haloplaca sp. 1 TL-2023]
MANQTSVHSAEQTLPSEPPGRSAPQLDAANLRDIADKGLRYLELLESAIPSELHRRSTPQLDQDFLRSRTNAALQHLESLRPPLLSGLSGRPPSQLDAESLRGVAVPGLQYLESFEAQREMVMPTSSNEAEVMDIDNTSNDKRINGMQSWQREAPKVEHGQLQKMPMELILEIEKHLPAPDVVALSHTCSRLYHSSPVVIEDYV